MNILRVVLSVVMLMHPGLSMTLASQVDVSGEPDDSVVAVSGSGEASSGDILPAVSSLAQTGSGGVDSGSVQDEVTSTGSLSIGIISLPESGSLSTGGILTGGISTNLSGSEAMIVTGSEPLPSTGLSISGSGDSTNAQIPSAIASPGAASDIQFMSSETTGGAFSGVSSGASLPVLVISEVFVDGTDEWFELTNRGGSLFTGTLVVSGVKSSPVTLTNVSLPSGVSRVYGDVMSKIADQSVIAKSGLSLNMADTAAINISLSWSGIVLDQFQISSSLVSSYDNEATSFELLNSGGAMIIAPTSVDRTRNILSQWIANPGEFDILSATGSSSTGSTGSSGTNNSGQQLSGADLLKITEVYFEGVQEWIELSNLSNTDRTGSFSLIGANNGILILSGFTIPALSSVVLADNDVHILDKSVVLVSGLTMVLNDLGAIDISLLVGGSLIDRFNVDSSLVTPYVNATNSFERVRYAGQLIITVATGSRTFNIQSGIIANPGKIFSVVDPVIILDDDDGLDNGSTMGSGTGSGTILTGGFSTGSCINVAGSVSIVEVHHADSVLSDYVEIIASTTLSGVRIAWASGTDSLLSLTLWSGQRYVIAPSSVGFPLPENVILIPGLVLSVTGGKIVLSRDGQIFDSVVYGGAGGGSLAVTSSDGCVRQFADSQVASPGFDERILGYTQIQTVQVVTTNTVYVGGGGGGSCPATTPINTGQICSAFISGSFVSGSSLSGINYTGINYTGTNQTGTNLTGLSSSGMMVSGGISGWVPRIVSIDYDPVGSDVGHESIQFGFDGPLPLSLKPYTLHRGSTRKTMNSLVMTSAVQMFTGSRSFPNSPTCVTLQSGSFVLDTYCYPVIQTGFSSTGSQSTGLQLTGSYVHLKIDSILYDPPGTDRNKETITFSTLDFSVLPVDMSRYTLHRGKTTKKITSSLMSSPQTILANRSFPNRSTCVQLRFDKTVVVDTYCYTVQKKQEPKKSEEIQTGGIVKEQQITTIPEISIVSLVSDPEGSDQDKESITLLLHTPASFDLSQARLGRGKTTKKINGLLAAGQMLTLTGSFGFPNRDECINLLVDKQIVDTYCYVKSVKSEEGSEEKQKKETESGTIQTGKQNFFVLATGMTANIVAVMPNPKGADKDKETITFLLTQGEQLDLSQTYLQIGTKKISNLSGVLELGVESRQIGSFSLPNKASCIDWKMKGSDQMIDRFCYTQAKDNVIVRKSLSGLEELSEEQVLALGQIGLLKRNKDICATYDGDIIRCRSLPTRAVRLPRTDELRLYQNYISRVHDIIKSDRYPVYAYTPLRQFNDTFDTLKSMISKFQTQVALSDGRQVPIYDLTSVHQDRYGSSYYDRVTQTLGDVLLGPDSPPRQRLVAMWYGEDVFLGDQ